MCCTRLSAGGLVNYYVDCRLEDVVDTVHFFAAALHVHGAHFLCDCLALGRGDGCETLGLEEIDAGALVAEIGLETDEDDGCCWAEVEDFRIPLWRVLAFDGMSKVGR